MKIKPFANFAIIKPVELADLKETSAGLLMPEERSQNYSYVEGTVMETGPNCVKVKTGDRVLYRRYSLDELRRVDEAGKPYSVFMLEEDEVIALLEDD